MIFGKNKKGSELHKRFGFFFLLWIHALCRGIVAAGGLLLAGLREVGDALQVADDAGHVVDVLRVAVGALLQVALVDVAAVVADGVGNVEREVVAALLGSHLQQLAVLLLREVLLQVHVEGRSAREVLNVGRTVELELVDDGERVVLDDVEVGVVAVARHEVAVLAVPLGVLHADVLGRNHLAVEHHVLRAVLLVILLDEAQDALHEAEVVVVGRDLQAHELGSLDEAVDADGQILAPDVDVAGVEEREHAVLLQLLQVLVVGQLHLVAEVDDAGEVLQVVLSVVDGILDATVQVDGQHRLRSGGDATGAQRVGEAVVGDLVAQTAARRERVGIVAHVGEERVALAVHLGREVAPLLVEAFAVAVGQQGHRLDGEGEQRLGALLVEPLHEALLQPRKAGPVGLLAVGEVELAENRLEVILVIVSHVPEDGLVVAGAGGLVERVDDLLEAVGDDLVDGALLERQVDHLVGAVVVVLAILQSEEVVHVHQELGRGAGTREHRRDHEHHVGEAAAERLQVGRGRRVAADGGGAAYEPGVHRDRGAVVGQRGLVVLIYKVVGQLVDVFVGQLLSVHLLDAVGQQAAVQAYEVRLGQLADERGYVFVFHVGIGVVLRTGGRVDRLHVFREELHLLQRLAVLGVLLTVEDKRFGHAVVALAHQRFLHLILNILHGDVVVDVQVAENLRDSAQVRRLIDALERLDDGVHDLVEREAVFRAIPLRDGEVLDFHY